MRRPEIFSVLSGFLKKSTGARSREVTIMQVTEVEIAFVKPKDGLIAFASVILDDQLYLSGMAVHSKLGGTGYRLTYPTRKVGQMQFSLFHPIRKPIGLAIEQAVFEKMKNVLSKCNAGHNRVGNSAPAIPGAAA
jgi:DNA-binding cell septation regulator SpoVG